MEGFLVFHFLRAVIQRRLPRCSKWYAEGKLKNEVDLQQGLENAPKTIIRLFTGANFGKPTVEAGRSSIARSYE